MAAVTSGPPISDPIYQVSARVFGDHAHFLDVMLSEPSLKKRAHNLAQKYQGLASGNKPLTYLKLWGEVRQLTADVVAAKQRREPVGCVFQALVEHMLEESDLFGRMLHGVPVSLPELMEFSAHHNETALLFVTHVLDPSEERWITAVAASAHKFDLMEQQLLKLKTPQAFVQAAVLQLLLNQAFDKDGGALDTAVKQGAVSSLPGAAFFSTLLEHEAYENIYISSLISSITSRR